MKEAAVAIWAAVDKLDREDRLLFVYRVVKERPYKEIANLLKRREDALRQRVTRDLLPLLRSELQEFRGLMK
jgi:DNA-directed RNA polymerase specialized sigma24 family protein